MNQPLSTRPSIAQPGILWTVIRVALLSLTAVFLLAPIANAQTTYVLSNALTIATGTGNLAGSTTAVRGIAYNVVSNQIFVVNASGTSTFDAFDGTSGAVLGALNTTGISGGTFSLDQVGIADDGAIYAINLSTGSFGTADKIYRWANYLATNSVAYSGNAMSNGASISLTNNRLGDTFAVTGSGTNTLLLAGVGSSKAFTLFYTTDGVTFNPVIVSVPSGYTAGGSVYGLCFFTNNTFLVKSASSGNSTVYLIQYPANFASSNIVTGTVLGTTTLGSAFASTTLLSYSPTYGLLAAVETGNTPTGVSPIGLFSLTNITTGATLLTSSNATTTYAGGNASGGIAIVGTNSIYELTTGNPLYRYSIISVPPVAPTISTAPAGGTFYSSDTLTVAATGTQPLTYQWLASSNNTSISTTFTNISGATSSSLTVATAGTNYYEVIISNIAGSITSSPVQLTILTPVTSPVVTNLWRVAVGASGYPYLANDNGSRGLGYDTNTQRLIVASITGGSGLYIVDANTGSNIGTLSLTNISFSGLLGGVDQVVAADDGAVYAGNLVSGSGFTMYRWASPTVGTTGIMAFSDAGSLGGADRWGDTMAVRGAGASTQILLGSRSGTNVALLTTPDGTNFNGIYIAITNAPTQFAANGITFGAGNTLWAKADAGHLYEISYDPTNHVGGVLFDYANPSKIPTHQVGVGVDSVNNILAGIDLSDSPDDLKLYQLTGTSDAPVLFNQSLFASDNANGNANVAIAMKFPRVYGLDVNNGLIGLTYGNPPTSAPTIATQPANITAYTNDPALSLQVGVSGSLPIYYQWQYSATSNGTFVNVSGATNSAYTLSYPALNQAGYYNVVVHNVAGSVTSAPALVTLLVPVTSPVVTNIWSIAAGGSVSFLDGSTYNTRGLAHDPTSGQLVVADHFNLHLLNAANGAYLGDLNAAGVYSGGLNGFLFDQVGVAADGTLYAGNLVLNGTNFVITSWAPGFTVGTVGTAFVYGGSGVTATGADPGNGSNDRWGDTLSVRGSGTNTEILIGSSGTNIVVFTTTDGQNFTNNLIPVTNVPSGFCSQGIAFGAGDTIWAKAPGYDLRQVAFNRTNWTGGAVLDFVNGTQIPSAFSGIAVDVSANILAGVDFSDTPNDVQLYLLSGTTTAPSLFDQSFFSSVNPNGQFNSVTSLKGGKGFALDANNGIIAFNYGTPAAPGARFVNITYAPNNLALSIGNVFSGHSYQVQSTTSLSSPSWSSVGSPVTATTNSVTLSVTDTSTSANTKFYRVKTN